MATKNNTLLLIGGAALALFLLSKKAAPDNTGGGGGGNAGGGSGTPSGGSGAETQGDNSGNVTQRGDETFSEGGSNYNNLFNRTLGNNGPVIDRFIDSANNSFDNKNPGNTGGVY
jgi:hypothetical protein